MNNIILSVGYNETGTHFIFYGLDDQELFRTHVTDIDHVNIHNVLDGQALEAIRRIFYPEYCDDEPEAIEPRKGF